MGGEGVILFLFLWCYSTFTRHETWWDFCDLHKNSDVLFL